MIIWTQDASQLIELQLARIVPYGNREAAIFVASQYSREGVFAGVYDDEARARGVLYDIATACKNNELVFRMPQK